jgi:hypothetical protein
MVDGQNVPHIAYSGAESGLGDLWHAWLRDGDFANEPVDGFGHGSQKSWVIGSPEPRLVYDNYLYAVVAYEAVRDAAGSWSVVVEELPRRGAASAAVWRDGRVQAARLSSVRTEYVRSPGDTSNAWLQGLTLNGQTSESLARLAHEEVIPGLALAFDGAGTAHIVYAAPNDELATLSANAEVLKRSEAATYMVRYVTVDSGGLWSEPEVLSQVEGWYMGLSVVVDDADRVHVVFSGATHTPVDEEGVAFPAGITHLEREPGAAWVRELVPTTGVPELARGSLALGGDGDLHLIYQSSDSASERSSVFYARKFGGTWSTEAVETGCLRFGDKASLARGADGSVHAAYLGCDAELVYVTRATP